MCSCLAEQKLSVLGSCDKSEMVAASQKRCRGHYYDGMQILAEELWFALRHSEGADVLFYDEHVKYLPKQQIYKRPPGSTVTQQWRLNMQMWQPVPGKESIDE